MSSRNAIDREALRGLIRQMLRDAVPADMQKKLAAALAKKRISAKAKPTSPAADEPAEEVNIASDGDLHRFVQRLLTMVEDGAVRQALKSGQKKFRLAKSGVSSSATPRPQPREEGRRPAAQNAGGNRIDKGLVAERHIVAAAKNGKRLTVAKGVAVTPLARDKARQLGVVIERE